MVWLGFPSVFYSRGGPNISLRASWFHQTSFEQDCGLQSVPKLSTLPVGALSAAAVLATVRLRSLPATFVKSDVMAELSAKLRSHFCVLLSEQSVRLPSLPTSL